MDSLWSFIILAFGAGFTALLTPCVFPMIPLTVSYFGQQRNDKSSGVRTMANEVPKGRGIGAAILYGFFIVLIYVITGTVVARINGPEFANWLSTHWLPNLFFFAIFLVFAASFLGMFELTLPNSWINKMDRLSGKQGTLGVFFMAFTLVLVSFSCTGPIVGSVLVLSAGGEVIKPVVGMFAFSLALALPFTLFAAFPKWLEKLPKSGGWLQEVKIVLGFLELALALKFLSIADQVYHWGLLDREVYLALWIVIFALLGLYLLGKLKLPHDSEDRKTTVPKLFLAIVVLGFVAYLVPGMVGAPLKPLSGYLPPMTTQEFNLYATLNRDTHDFPAEGTEGSNSISDIQESLGPGCLEPKYNDILKLPHDLKGYFDLEQAKQCAKAQGKPIFVDFTGHGCVNCRAMEARVWSDPRVLEILRNDYVVVALYVDDKTELPEASWYVSEYDGKVKKTMGKQNADYQITAFTNNAQPFYVVLNPEGESLVEPMAYNLEIDHFIEFLKSGLRAYHDWETL